jgi:succinoglycan biosynthesis transport protein ExoP
MMLLGSEDELNAQWLGTDYGSFSAGHIWLILKRRVRLIMWFTAATIAVTGVVVFLLLRPMYKAETALLIERNAPQVLDVQQQLFSPDLLDAQHDFYKTQEDLLGSEILAARVITKLGLADNSMFLESYLGGFPGLVADYTRLLYYRLFPVVKSPDSENALHVDVGLIKRYQSRLSIVPALNAQIISVAFLSPDPVLSARIANAHAQAYIDEGLKLKTQPSEEAEEFLREKLAEVEQKLKESEINLNNYRRQSGLVYLNDDDQAKPGSGEGGHRTTVIERLDELSKLLAAAEADRIAQEAEARLVHGQQFESLPAVVSSPLVQNLKEQLAVLQGSEASLASTYTPDHPKLMKAHAQTEDVRNRLRQEISNIAAATQASYLAAQSKEQNLELEMDNLKVEAMKLKDAGVEDTILAREVDTNQELYQGILQRMKEMGMQAQLRASNISVIDPAVPPPSPAIPEKALSLMLSLIIGLAGGIGLALTYEYLDNTLETPAEVEATLRLPNLSVIPDFMTMVNGDIPKPPAIGHKNGKVSENGAIAENGKAHAAHDPKANGKAVPIISAAGLPTLAESPYSAATEAFRTLCTGLILSQPDHPPRTILFSSTRKGEGKTVTILNTAVAFAQAGRRVLVIDADLRRSRCHRVLGLENGIGLTEVLTGQVESADALRRVIEGQGKGGVWLMSSGSRPPNPGALLGSKRMLDVILQMRDQFDHVLIDSCPLVPMSDALILSSLVDGVVLVVLAGETPRNVVRDSVVHLVRAHANPLGVVLNRVDMKNSDYAYYFYRHYSPYYAEEDGRIEA